MTNVRGRVLGELQRFVRAALIDPAYVPVVESASVVRRRRIVVVLTAVAGAVVLALTLRIPAGDPLFVPAALGLAALWTVGAFASGPLHLGWAATRSGGKKVRPVVQPIVLGLALLGIFLLGGILVSFIPVLLGPVEQLLRHASEGTLSVIVLVTVVNGVAEELFFRGALFAAVPARWAIVVSTIAYVLTTAGSGIPLLVFAAAVIGLVTAFQRRVTGGVLAPILTHITWSVGMLLLLPSVLSLRS